MQKQKSNKEQIEALKKLIGILKGKAGEEFERIFKTRRKIHALLHKERSEKVAKAMSGEIDSSEIYEISQETKNKADKLRAKLITS